MPKSLSALMDDKGRGAMVLGRIATSFCASVPSEKLKHRSRAALDVESNASIRKRHFVWNSKMVPR